MIDRRELLVSSASLSLLAPFASIADTVANPDARLVLVILRGGLDGLAAVPPYGERSYRTLRGDLALDGPGYADGVLDLDGHFGLHPQLQGLHEMYLQEELAVLHAVATPYRDRSHFDGQKVLEAGGTTAATSAGGWLNRSLTALRDSGNARDAIALAPNVPLVLRGDYSVASWAPSRLPDSSEDTIARVRELYEATDKHLAEQLIAALNAREIAGTMSETESEMEADMESEPESATDLEMEAEPEAGAGPMLGERRRRRQTLAPLTTAAGRFLRADDGPRVAVLDAGGWDTHANQGTTRGRLASRLSALDQGLARLKAELGHAWSTTAVLVVTEFGRTAAVNGTGGTDHGTGGCALLAGGAVDGGRVITDWPGLGPQALLENRDLRPTLDLRAVFKGVLATQFGLGEAPLERRIFPGSTDVPPLDGLISVSRS